MVLSYRHSFHAGNSGDVVKHSILSLLLASLAAKKPKAFLYLDTHAAAGQYALSEGSNSEYRTGIARLWTRRDLPRCLSPYLHAVRSINALHALPLAASSLNSSARDDCISDEAAAAFALPPMRPVFPDAAYSPGSLQRYPGSPSLFLHLRRPQDRMLAYEAHSTEHGNLQRCLATQQRSSALYPYYPPSSSASPASPLRECRVMPGDGFLSYSLFPQPERRGLCLVDPAYELPEEYERLAPFLRRCVRRFASGVYCCWYPLIAGKEQLSEKMIAQTRDAGWSRPLHRCSRSQSTLISPSAGCPPSAAPSLRLSGIPRMLHVRFSLRNFLADRLPSSANSSSSSSQQPGLSSVRQPRRTSLYGCGLLIVNPPHLLQPLLSSSLLPFLSTALASEQTPADWSVDWLVGEEQRREEEDVTQTAAAAEEAASQSQQPAAPSGQ